MLVFIVKPSRKPLNKFGKPSRTLIIHKIRKITEDRLKPYIKRQSSILPVISEYTALLFIHLFTFHCQIFHPSVFLIIQVHSRDLYKFIQTDDKVNRKHRKFQYKCSNQPQRNHNAPHGNAVTIQSKFTISTCTENSVDSYTSYRTSDHIISTDQQHSFKITF